MSWASERLEFINKIYSYSQIESQTGIPSSTISYVIREERTLPNKYRSSLRNAYQRTAYQYLRDTGLSSTQARRFSWYSPSKIYDVLSEVTNTLATLVNARFQQYKDHLIAIGQFIDDQTTIDSLTSAIQNALRHSDLPEERLAASMYNNTNAL